MNLVKLKNDRIYIHNSFFSSRYYIITVGIRALQGYKKAQTYLSNGNFSRHTIEVTKRDNSLYLRRIDNLQKDWKGVSIRLSSKERYLDVTSWLMSYSPYILIEAYVDYDKEIELDLVSTQYTGYQVLRSGLQLEGDIRLGDFDQLSKYSTEFVLSITYLPDRPMTPRMGDRRNGVFYGENHNQENDALFNDPFIFINRRNLKSAPWIYVIDCSISKSNWKPIRMGVEHWNNFFEYLGLGKPLVVLDPEQEGYPEKVNIFDQRYNYIVDHSPQGLNSFYTGVSQDFVDFRSGEILFGNI